MAIDLEKFVKAKRFTADHTLDDASDQVLVKTSAGSSVGDAIAAAIAGVSVADATDTTKGVVTLAVADNMPSTSDTEAATPAAVNAAIAANNTAMGATAAETIAGTVSDKFISPDDLSAALQDGANYQLNLVNPTAHTGLALGSVAYMEGDASGGASQPLRVYFIKGTVGAANRNFTNAITGALDPAVVTPVNTVSQGVAGDNQSQGAGTKIGVSGFASGVGGTNIGVYGYASNGATNWAGYFDGNTYAGRLQVGSTSWNSSDGALKVKGVYGVTAGAVFDVDAEALHTHIAFHTPSGQKGDIKTASTGTSYNSVSDYRLKTVDGPLTGSGAFIDALQPKVGEWKAEPGKKAAFFIAHEVQEVSPSTVQGEKDAVDEDGKPVVQSMEYGSAEFIVNIIAELQSLRKRVAELEAKA